MNIFKRLFKIGEAEAHSAIEKMEDPIKLTEQGIRDLKADLAKSIEALAEVKAITIRSRNDEKKYTDMARDYEQKAIAILKKEDINDTDKDRLAEQALLKKEENAANAQNAKAEYEKTSKSVQEIEAKINKLKSTISQWENELRTLKSRVKVSKAQTNLNKQMAQIDSNSTVSMLERMRDKVAQEEAKAEAYGEIAESNTSIEEEINKAAYTTSTKASDQLAALKKKLAESK
jgi:phage shock protein A